MEATSVLVFFSLRRKGERKEKCRWNCMYATKKWDYHVETCEVFFFLYFEVVGE
jgi:hypothetical protein